MKFQCLMLCDALRDLVPFVQFKNPGIHPWRSVTFIKIAGFQPATLLKVTLHYGCFPRVKFVKLCKWYQIVQNITYITEQTVGLFHSFPLHLSLLPENIRNPFRGVEKGCIGNKWVKIKMYQALNEIRNSVQTLSETVLSSYFIEILDSIASKKFFF